MKDKSLLVFEMTTALRNPKIEGLKFVLFQIVSEGKTKGFDYGFANWTGEAWEEVDPSATVFMWAEIPNPKILF